MFKMGKCLLIISVCVGLASCSKSGDNPAPQPPPPPPAPTQPAQQAPPPPNSYTFGQTCGNIANVPYSYGSPDIQAGGLNNTGRIVNRQLRLYYGVFTTSGKDKCLNDGRKGNKFEYSGALSAANGNIILNFDGAGLLSMFMLTQYGNFCPTGPIPYTLNPGNQTIEIGDPNRTNPIILVGSPSPTFVSMEIERGTRRDRKAYGVWADEVGYNGDPYDQWDSFLGQQSQGQGMSGQAGGYGYGSANSGNPKFRVDYQPGQPQVGYPQQNSTNIGQGSVNAGVIQAIIQRMVGKIDVAAPAPQHVMKVLFMDQRMTTTASIRSGDVSCESSANTVLRFVAQ